MDKGKAMIFCSAVISTISVAIGLMYHESVMSVLSMFALFFSILTLIYCSSGIAHCFVLVTGAIVLICTVLMSTVLSHDTLVNGNIISNRSWMCLSGAVHGIAVVPIIATFYFVVASAFQASFNWFLVAALGPFVGLGILAPGIASVLYIQSADIATNVIENVNLILDMTASVVVLAIVALIVLRYMKKNRLLVTENGIETNAPMADSTRPWEERGQGITKEENRKETMIASAVLLISLSIVIMMYAYVTSGRAPGLDAGHPVEYLQTTCLVWIAVTAILPALRLLRLVSLPMWFTILVNANMCIYIISLCQGLYLEVDWWGNLSHQLASFIVASIVFLALCLMQTYSPKRVSLGSRNGLIIMMIPLAASFGCIWEIAEGFTDIISGTDYMVYGIEDTLSDLWADILGLFIMTAIAWFILGRESPEKISSKVRIGKNAMRII